MSERRAGSIPRSVIPRFALNESRSTGVSLGIGSIGSLFGARAFFPAPMVASAPPTLGVGTPMDAQLMLPLIDMAQWSTNLAVRPTPTPSPRAATRPVSRGRIRRSDLARVV